MRLYLDESGIDGISKDIFVGGIFTSSKVDKNIVRQTILKSFKKAPNLQEYKYTKMPAGLDGHAINISKCIACIIDKLQYNNTKDPTL